MPSALGPRGDQSEDGRLPIMAQARPAAPREDRGEPRRWGDPKNLFPH